jgi:hypothetical protein
VGRKQGVRSLGRPHLSATVEGARHAGVHYASMLMSPVEELRPSERDFSSRLHQLHPILEKMSQYCAFPCAKAASQRHGQHHASTRRGFKRWICEFGYLDPCEGARVFRRGFQAVRPRACKKPPALDRQRHRLVLGYARLPLLWRLRLRRGQSS